MTCRRSMVGLCAAVVTAVAWSVGAAACGGNVYDVVISGGRVIDPESGLDAPRNVGILGGRIAVVSESQLEGDVGLDATGLVVAGERCGLRSDRTGNRQAHP